MQITLPPEAQAIIDRKLASGEFATEEEIITSALFTLDLADRVPSVPQEMVADALEQIKRGQTVAWTDDFMERASTRARENARRGKPVSDDVKY